MEKDRCSKVLAILCACVEEASVVDLSDAAIQFVSVTKNFVSYVTLCYCTC